MRVAVPSSVSIWKGCSGMKGRMREGGQGIDRCGWQHGKEKKLRGTKSGLHYTEEYLVPAAVALDQVKYQS